MKLSIKPFNPPLVPVILSLIIGILAGDSIVFCALPVMTSGIALFFWVIYLKCIKKKRIYFWVLLLFAVIGYLLIVHKVNPKSPVNHIRYFVDSEPCLITAKIISFSKTLGFKKRMVIALESIRQEGSKTVKVTGKLNLSIYSTDVTLFGYGDIIQFSSKIRSIRNFNNPKGFDYEKYLLRQGIFGTVYAKPSDIEVVNSVKGQGFISRFIRKIERTRDGFSHFVLQKSENQVAGNILCALITGKKDYLSFETRDLFSKAGASHILAISGLHLSIVGVIFYAIFYWMWSLSMTLLISARAKKLAGLCTMIPMAAYAVFAGFSPSTQRALVMAGIFMISIIAEKEKDLLNSLAASGIIILGLDAGALFSISFQLSFSAVLFIILGLDLIKNKEGLLKNKLMVKIVPALIVTIGAGLGTMPLVAHYFNMVSFVQLFSNLIVIPVIGFIVLPLGFVSLCLFLFSNQLSGWVIDLLEPLILFCINAIQTLVSFPFSWAMVVTLNWIEVITAYLFLFSIILFIKRKPNKGLFLLVNAMIIALICVGIGVKQRFFNQLLHISVLDVGQGNCALIQAPYGKRILVDAAGFSGKSTFDVGRYVIAPFLWQKKIKSLDAVILSHPQADHMNGLAFIFDNFKVKAFIKNKDISSSKSYLRIMEAVNEKQVPVVIPANDNKPRLFGDVIIKFFNSPEKYYDNINENSLVCKLVYKSFSMLFCGDIMEQREKELGRKYGTQLRSTIILSPHHGSSTSNSKFFLEKVQPKSVIISCGWHNRYRFPKLTVLDRYNKLNSGIIRTDLNGAVMITSNGNTYNIITHKGG
ncbi:MAG: DNA internalization-related competence protein ComEC/Rec2 [Desulfobacteraceae bacterium]|nr:DNA internalization-related competence protein ComEC/Rec2 [Desulfobacteraceae bacterium]